MCLFLDLFWGPLEASEFDPLSQQFRVSKAPSLQGPLKALERLFRGLRKLCSLQTEQAKKVATQRPVRGPIFPMPPNPRSPTFGPQITLEDVPDIFYLFFCFGAGKGEEEFEAKRGGTFLLQTRVGGEFSEEGRRGSAHGGWEGVAGGGAKFFFSGPKCPLSNRSLSEMITSGEGSSL